MKQRPWREARVNDWIRLHLLREAGLVTSSIEEGKRNLEMRRCPSFAAARDARTLMGYFRYEQLGPRKGLTHNTPESIRVLLDLYISTKNREFLTDIANMAELEWQYPTFEGTYFEATDNSCSDIEIE